GPASHHVAHQTMSSETSCLLCHQPHEAKQHDDIIVSQKTSVCGQCHSRGKTKAVGADGGMTQFNFPLEYLPGQDLNSSFLQSTLQNDKKKKNWWGNGVSKNRHQEFADFSASKHAKALVNMRNKKNPHGGEKSDDCLQCHSQDYRSAPEGHKPTIETAKLGLTCVSCHEPHGADRLSSTAIRMEDKCGQCHIASFAKNEKPLDEAHFPCPSGKVTCADCHMPYIVKTGGAFSIRSHAFKIVPPEASLKYDMPNSCQNGSCHTDKTTEWAVNAYNNFYEQPAAKTLADTLKERKGR
ncbi:MAG: cytochrome c3 family protein, partial [Sulfurimonadaceae bacterium]|nr:cytochrome c3 family protein [Sulfurimonadaceae bacterium]